MKTSQRIIVLMITVLVMNLYGSIFGLMSSNEFTAFTTLVAIVVLTGELRSIDISRQ